MGAALKERIYTIEDIYALPDGVRAELIDGKLYNMAAPGLTHQGILMGLSSSVYQYIRANGGKCRVYPAPFAVFPNNDEDIYLEPDITVVCDPDKLDEKGCHGAPDWVVEIVSPSSRSMDYLRKLHIYERAGVRLYWIIDPSDDTVAVYDFEHDRIERHAFSEEIEVGIFAGLQIVIAGL